MIKAVIFDMDGLLIDSEPLWQESEILEFGKVGVPLTTDLCLQTVGFRINEVVDYWYARYPWPDFEQGMMEKLIVRKVIELVHRKGSPKEGLQHAIDFVKSRQVKLAVASSSFYEIIDAVLEKFGIKHEFNILHSAEDEKHGKPHPAVYLTTAKKLGVLPQECIAIEDSLNGVLSAKAATMKCIAVPDSSMKYNEKLIIADMQLRSLNELNEETWNQINV